VIAREDIPWRRMDSTEEKNIKIHIEFRILISSCGEKQTGSPCTYSRNVCGLWFRISRVYSFVCPVVQHKAVLLDVPRGLDVSEERCR
jgi:hypothetical protein